jgi:hypothetical protein
MIENKIYFICKATNINDTIDSINNLKKNIFEFFPTKIKNDDNPKLEEIGIKETYLCQENKKILNILQDKIYCALDISSIECASILLNPINGNTKIYPIPYISSEKIQNKKLFDIFKKQFGEYTLNIPNCLEKTNMTNYWKTVNNNFSSLKKKQSDIDWSKIYPKNLSNYTKIFDLNPLLLTYNFNKFYELLIDLCNENNKPIIIVCDHKIIIDILKRCKHLKYNKTYDIIERTSVWEVIIEQTPTSIIFDRFDKIYPKLPEHLSYKYKGNNYKLFNSLQDIPTPFLKLIVQKLIRHPEARRPLIKDAYKAFNKTNASKEEASKKENNKPFKIEELT